MFGVTRQAYYQHGWHHSDKATEARILLNKVALIRKDQPRIGTRKIYCLLQPDLERHNIKMGRDALFELLSSEGLLVRKRKRRPQTTFSKHWLKKYDNLILWLEPYAAHQLWVSDITYISLADNSFIYLALICDAYSHKIVGYNLNYNLSARGSIKALEMALEQLPKEHSLIHHSDRGAQYCSHEYVRLLNENKVAISMTRSGDPYENAVAERLNGILKDELLLEKYSCFDHANESIQKAISIYNKARPHLSCQMLTPEDAHNKVGRLDKLWKRKERRHHME